jgi:transcriptional/translational regulatory protein YebC/TACO1
VPSRRSETLGLAAAEVLMLVDTLEQDEDVQHVFHNLA